ncbi:MAG: hypothetical protein U9O78_01290, partial [Patescibacteria group bacterium]|nr:hypothetical protein [Patescibacteria group bacterium]
MKKQFFITFIQIFLLMFVVGLISSRLLFHANKDAIHYDEPTFIERGIFLDYYLKRDFKQSFWTSYVAYDVPKLGEFIYGA